MLLFSRYKILHFFFYLLLFALTSCGERRPRNWEWISDYSFPLDESQRPIYRGIQQLRLHDSEMLVLFNYKFLNIYNFKGAIIDSFNTDQINYKDQIDLIVKYEPDEVSRDSSGNPTLSYGDKITWANIYVSPDNKVYLSYRVRTETHYKEEGRNITHGHSSQFISQYSDHQIKKPYLLHDKNLYKKFGLSASTVKGFAVKNDTLYANTLQANFGSGTFPLLGRFTKRNDIYYFDAIYENIRYPTEMYTKYQGNLVTVFMVKEINSHIFCSNGLELFDVSELKRVWSSENDNHYLYELSYCADAEVYIARILDSEKREFYFSILNKSFEPIDTLPVPTENNASDFTLDGCRLAFITKNNDGYEAQVYHLDLN